MRESTQAAAGNTRLVDQNSTDFLESAKPSNVMRSGMTSRDNPITTTSEYYPPVNNAVRQNGSNQMF